MFLTSASVFSYNKINNHIAATLIKYLTFSYGKKMTQYIAASSWIQQKYSSPFRDLDNKIGYLLAVGDVWMITVW